MTDVLDVKKLPEYRARAGVFALVEPAPARYLAIDGAGDPNTEPFAEATSALYPHAYALKFASKQAGQDFTVPPLEGLWWANDMEAFTSRRNKAAWRWTLLLRLPPWIDDAAVDAARAKVRAKKDPPARLDDVRVEPLDEGLCVQTLHVGPFDAEGPVLDRLHREFIPAEGLAPTGRHHEIYLGDPRRTAPEKLRTILRQPVAPAS